MRDIIARNIIRKRKRLGITQEELADMAEINVTYLGYIENAKHNISIKKLQQLAAALDVSVTELITE